MSWVLSSLLLASVFVGPSACTMINRTIDDKNGDEVTHQVPVTCGISTTPPHGVESDRLFNSTWHDTTVHPNDPPHTIALSFTGSAVYVFNMIANRHGTTSTETHITFFIDDENVGQYDHTPNDTSDFQYQVPVYTNSTLPYGEHSLKIVADGTQLSLVLFDYVVYTTEDDTSSVASAATSSPMLSKTIRPASSTHTSIPSPTPHPTTHASIPPPAPQHHTNQTSIPSPPPLHPTDPKRLATVAGVAAALSFICGMVALAVFRARKYIMLYVRRARGRSTGTQKHRRVYPAGSSSSSSHSSLDVNFTNSSSSLMRFNSPSGISHLPSTPLYAVLHEASAVPRGSPLLIQPNVPIRPRPSPPTHSVDVPRSAVSSSRTGTDHSFGSISELRRELRSLREKMRELQSPRKHRLRLADGHSAEPGAESSEAGGPVSLAPLREEV
ncbi:hypothetical protein LXA43DRAFT_1013838 [Ganoderma leucocontextum]|nr:hypothetical protein LXA43DRAFT_1013838 [Ganoderma leucocontextum]